MKNIKETANIYDDNFHYLSLEDWGKPLQYLLRKNKENGILLYIIVVIINLPRKIRHIKPNLYM